jgi:class 3 adenylate cyclase
LNDQLQIYIFIILNLLLLFIISIINKCFSLITIQNLKDYLFLFQIFIPIGFNYLIKLSLIFKRINIINNFKKFINKLKSNKFLLNKDIKIKNNNNSFEIINSECLYELGCVKNIIFTKNKLFTNKSFIIKSIVTEEYYTLISYKNIENINSENTMLNKNNQINSKYDDFSSYKLNKSLLNNINNNIFKSEIIQNIETEEVLNISSNLNETNLNLINTNDIYEKALQINVNNSNYYNIKTKNDLNKSKINCINLNKNSDLNKNNNHNIENNIPEIKSYKLKIENIIIEKNKNNLSNYIYFDNMKEILNLIIILIDLSILGRDKNYNDKTENYLDKVILEFLLNFGIRILKIRSTKHSVIGFEVVIQNKEEQLTFIVIALDEYYDDLKIIYLNEFTNTMNLIIRCSNKKLKENYLMNILNKEYIDQIIKQNKNNNLESLFYLHKVLNENEIIIWDELLKKFTEKIIEKDELFIKFLNSLDKHNKFNFFFGIGFSEDFINNSEFFKEIHDSGIKISYLSKHNFNSTISFAHHNNLIDSSLGKSNVLQIKINITNKEKGLILFKESCDNFEKFIKNKKLYLKSNKIDNNNNNNVISNKNSLITNEINHHNNTKHNFKLELIVSAKSLPLILSEPYFYYNFKILLEFSDIFIVYKINKIGIEQILLIFNTLYNPRQNIFISKEENIFKYNNILINPSMKINKHLLTDISLNNINILKFLIFKKGLFINKSISKFRYLISIITNINFMSFFILNVFNFTSINIQNYYFIFLLFHNIILFVFSIIIFHFWKISNSLNNISNFLIYKMNLFKIQFEIKNILLFMLIGIFLGFLISLGYYFIDTSNIDLNLIHFVFFTVSGSIITLFFLTSNKNKFINFLIIISIFIFVLIINYMESIYNINILNTKNFITNNLNSKILYNFTIYFIVIITLIILIHKYILKYLFILDKINSKFIHQLENMLNKYDYKNIIFQNKIYKLTPNINIIDSSIRNIFYTGEINNDNIYIDDFTLKFSDKKLEKYSKNHFLFKYDFKLFRKDKILILVLITLTQILNDFINLNNNESYDYSQKILLYIFILFLILISFFLKKQNSNIIINSIYSLLIILFYNIFYHSNSYFYGINFIYYFNYLLCIQNKNVVITIFTLSIYTFSFVILYILFFNKYNYILELSFLESILNIIYLIASVLIYNIYNLILNHKSNSLKINNFFVKLKLDSKKNYNNELINLLMPKFVLSRISFNLKENCLAEDAGNVAIIFVEICNFNLILTHYKENIIMFLDKLFKDFDNQCEKYGIQKIETVGKTYLAASGIIFMESKLNKNIRAMNPVQRIFEFALSLIKIAEMYHYGNANKIVIKIGIHEGKATMGVLGYHKPQFSLIGDTINTTSRLCTTGENGHIMISTDTFEKIKNIVLEYKLVIKEVDTPMKGKGVVKVVHVFKKGNIMKNKIIHLAKKILEFGRRDSMKGNMLLDNSKIDSIIKNISLIDTVNLTQNNIRENKSESEIPISFTIKELTALSKLTKFEQTNNFILFMKCMQILKSFDKKETHKLTANIKLLDNIKKDNELIKNNSVLKKESSIEKGVLDKTIDQKRRSLMQIVSKEQVSLEELKRMSVDLNSKNDITDDDSDYLVN